MKDSGKLKKARPTEAQQTRRDDSAAIQTTVAAEAISNIAATGAAPKYKPSESSRHRSPSLPIPPSIPDRTNLADDEEWLTWTNLADDEKWLTFPEAHGHPLLPGLPNDITVTNIVPKLGWRDFYTLSTVSPAWCHAIRSRQVYDERVRTGSTETLVLLCYEPSRHAVPVVALYSMEDDSWFELPPLPKVLGGVFNPRVSRCVGLDGNVYLLEVQERTEKSESRNCGGILDTYVFDLAGQRPWLKCARMSPEGYHHLSEYGILDGKIYSIGGCGKTALSSRGSNQVYDPVKNTWSPIKPMRSLRFGHQVEAVGDELYVVDGGGCDEYFDSDGNPVRPFSKKDLGSYFIQFPTTVQIYHPLRDEWRVVNGFHPLITDEWKVVSGFWGNRLPKTVFVAQGKLHALSGRGIHKYDLDAQLSAQLQHSVSLEQLGGPANVVGWIRPITAQVVGDEILAIVTWYPRRENRDSEVCIIRCKGIGSQNQELIWTRAKTPRSYRTPGGSTFSTMSRIHL